MSLDTPALRELGLDALASRYVRTDEVPWERMCEGIEMKVLVRDDDTGLFTGLFRLAPGAVVPDHVHNEIEQTYVLEGTFSDEDGDATPAISSGAPRATATRPSPARAARSSPSFSSRTRS